VSKVSLRLRLILSIGLILVVSIVLGSVIVYWHAVHKVDEEMRAALDVGIRMVQNATDDVEDNADPLRQLQLLIEDFDGNRHLRASFLNTNGNVIVASKPLESAEPAPAWFNHFIARRPETAWVQLPPAFAHYGSIFLETDSHNEIDEVWSDIFVTLAILAIFCILVLSLIYWMLGRAFYFLDEMSVAFASVGAGDYGQRCNEKGPRELAVLAQRFNDMVARLALMEGQNRRLEVQLTTMQEEERTDLARDLHDEIGPLLFALSIDISAIQKQESARLDPEIGIHLDSMRGAVSEMQQHVRSMLGKLRPAILLDLGLGPAVDNLVSFWNLRRPDVHIEVRLSQETFGEALDATIYRIFQEGLNNAFRHGHPSWIAIKASTRDAAVDVEVSDNGEGLSVSQQGFGFGITGMRERVAAVGGTLTVENRVEEKGVTISAKLPLEPLKDDIGQEYVS
jgi:two-component system, NarL family, sensor histidine kinase UhpB